MVMISGRRSVKDADPDAGRGSFVPQGIRRLHGSETSYVCAIVGEWRRHSRARADIEAFAVRPRFGLSDSDLGAAIRDVHALASSVTGVLATLIHEAQGRDLPHRHDAVSTVTWLRDLVRISAAEARGLTTLGDLLAQRAALADAVTTGTVNTAQIAAIGKARSDVPDN
jgi:hypothetical protein